MREPEELTVPITTGDSTCNECGHALGRGAWIRVRELFSRCPAGTERAIAQHACLKYSGRVGRSAAAKALDADAVHLAVTAHLRHVEISYDKLRQVLDEWRNEL